MMTKTIPHGAVLIVLVGPSGSGKSTFAEEHFAGEIVSSDEIRFELTGDIRRQDKNDLVFAEFHHRIEARLLAGRRVVADATHLRNADRRKTAEIAKTWGFKVVYVVINRSVESKLRTAGWRENVRKGGRSLIESHEETFVANEKAILTGDHGIADMVVDTRVDDYTVAQPLAQNVADEVLYDLDRYGFNTIRVVGDVHGNMKGLNAAVDTAPEGTFFLFLGDVVDYGVDTLKATDFVFDMVAKGVAVSLRGNHEKKIARFVEKDRTAEGYIGEGTHGNNVTINQLKAMTPTDRLHWETRFLSFVEVSPDKIQIDATNGRWIFAHAAVHYSMIDDTTFRYHDKFDGKRHSFALYGETEKDDNGKVAYKNGYPIRKYDWVDKLSPNDTAVVGHAVLSTREPLVKTGSQGGRAIFLDTGSSKEVDGVQGHLSWMDLHLVKTKKGFAIEQGDFGREE